MRNGQLWRNAIERVIDWLALKEAVASGLRRLSCDVDQLSEQTRTCEVSVSHVSDAYNIIFQ